MLADEEGEGNQTDLTLVDLPQKPISHLPWRQEPSWNTREALSREHRVPITPRPGSSAHATCRRSVASGLQRTDLP